MCCMGVATLEDRLAESGYCGAVASPPDVPVTRHVKLMLTNQSSNTEGHSVSPMNLFITKYHLAAVVMVSLEKTANLVALPLKTPVSDLRPRLAVDFP